MINLGINLRIDKDWRPPGPGVPFTFSYLLQQNGFNVLQQNGDKIIIRI